VIANYQNSIVNIDNIVTEIVSSDNGGGYLDINSHDLQFCMYSNGLEIPLEL
jgi:hypothetical protein